MTDKTPKHAPLPLTVYIPQQVGPKRDIWIVDAADGVCLTMEHSDDALPTAELLVRAANAHEEMMETLDNALALLRHMREFYDYTGFPNTEQTVDTAIGRGDAALAKAKGSQ